MQYRTFDEWSALGFRIYKGSKAIDLNGKKGFSSSQVFIPPRKSKTNAWNGETSYNGDAEGLNYFGDNVDCGGNDVGMGAYWG